VRQSQLTGSRCSATQSGKVDVNVVTHDVAEAVTLADRVLMIEGGEISLDLRVDLPRPRERGSAEVAALEGRILRDLFRNSRAGENA